HAQSRATFSFYIQYRGILLPPIAHSTESLQYAEDFSVEDSDVFAVTYPKSGTVSFSQLLPYSLERWCTFVNRYKEQASGRFLIGNIKVCVGFM
uniref:Uncharacterized protein n=1 Tax=Cyclopterus lumpus TaxID=8103 RepID=A0A8C2WIE1_CYCLU